MTFKEALPGRRREIEVVDGLRFGKRTQLAPYLRVDIDFWRIGVFPKNWLKRLACRAIVFTPLSMGRAILQLIPTCVSVSSSG